MPPSDFENESWIGVAEAARRFRKSKKTIQNWFRDGLFTELKIRTYRDPNGWIWIYDPRKTA